MAVIIYIDRKRFVFKTPLTIPLLLFFFWSVLSVLWSLNVKNTVHDIGSHLLNHIIVFFILINLFNTRQRFKWLLWIVVFSALAFSAASLSYYYLIMGMPLGGRLGHIYQSINWSTELPSNFIGSLTIFAMLICINYFFQEDCPYRRIAALISSAVLCIVTILTWSRGSLIVLAIAITLILWPKMKKVNLISLIGLSLIIVIFFTPFKERMGRSSFVERLKINYVTAEVIKDHPVLGIGFGMKTFTDDLHLGKYTSNLAGNHKPVEILTPHNLLLDITVRLGLVGLSFFLSIIYALGRLCEEVIKNASDNFVKQWSRCMAISAVCYMTLGLSEPLFLFSASATIFYIILAAIVILSRLGNKDYPTQSYSAG